MNRPSHVDRSIRVLSLAVAVAIVSAACGATTPVPSQRQSETPAPTQPAPTEAPSIAPKTTSSPAPGPSGQPAMIPQPIVPPGLKTAPEGARVDLAMPTFSNPTAITNPLFPVSKQASVLMLGHVDGKPFRTEVTLLPFTRIVDWGGQRVETLVSQYCAYLDGRINEIADDLYAQADDGSVWYFGEDVFDFVDGAIVTTEGTWQAGRDGPAAMIMPAQPMVGDVYRTENAPGFVFEEVTVKAVDLPLKGPLGPIAGGLSVLELHSDGTTETKSFAPGYGEFRTAGGGDLEALALAVPTDASAGSTPAGLTSLSDGAMVVFDAIGTGNWASASRGVAALKRSWSTARGGSVPPAVASVMDRNLRALDIAIGARRSLRARSASIEVARSAFDLQLLTRPATEIDVHRFELWAAQTEVDVAAHDSAGVTADVFALDYARDRFIQTLDPPSSARLNTLLNDLQVAVVEDDMATARTASGGLRRMVAELTH
jgi:hypothetical protein